MNIGGTLITNGADRHPPESWASVTAAMIFVVDNSIAGARRIQAMELQAKLAKALLEHHAAVQTGEQTALQADKDRHASHEYNMEMHHLDEVVQEVVEAAQGSPWEHEFTAPEMDAKIRSLIGDHFATSMHIERQLHRRKLGLDPLA